MINIKRRECEIKPSQYRYGIWWESTGYEVSDDDGIWWNEFINSDGEINYFN